MNQVTATQALKSELENIRMSTGTSTITSGRIEEIATRTNVTVEWAQQVVRDNGGVIEYGESLFSAMDVEADEASYDNIYWDFAIQIGPELHRFSLDIERPVKTIVKDGGNVEIFEFADDSYGLEELIENLEETRDRGAVKFRGSQAQPLTTAFGGEASFIVYEADTWCEHCFLKAMEQRGLSGSSVEAAIRDLVGANANSQHEADEIIEQYENGMTVGDTDTYPELVPAEYHAVDYYYEYGYDALVPNRCGTCDIRLIHL